MTSTTDTTESPDGRSAASTTSRRRRTRKLTALLCGGAIAVGTLTVPSAVLAEDGPPGAGALQAAALNPAEYAAAMAYLAEKHPWAFDDSLTTEEREASINWAHELAKVVFGEGLSRGFDGFLKAIFGDNTANALADISASLEVIKSRMDDVEEAIRRLEESTAKAAFIAAEGHAKTYARDIRAQFKLIEGWNNGHAYDDNDVKALVDTSYTAVEQLDTHLLGAYGTQELLGILLEFGPRHQAWAERDAYREGYRASLATGLMNLEWAAEVDAKYVNHLEIARATATGTADALYETALRHERTNPSRDSLIVKSNGDAVGLTSIFGDGGTWSNVRFTQGESLPPTLTQDGQIMLHLMDDSWSWHYVSFHDMTLDVDLYTGAVTGTAEGSIRYVHGGPDFNWSFDSKINGNVDLDGNGRMVLEIPFQNVKGSRSTPFRHATLVLDPS